MTEQEAKDWLKAISCTMIDGVLEQRKEALFMGMKALEEIQEYRAIGTVEELKFIKQWKSDVVEGFCKYDASSIEELVGNARNKAIDEFAHELKETLNRDIPLNYESTRPYFTLENTRLIVEEVADQLKRNL